MTDRSSDMQRIVDHARVEMAGLTCRNLYGRDAFRPDTLRVVFGFKIAFNDGNAVLALEGIDRRLE
jgi:hypothetical protein